MSVRTFRPLRRTTLKLAAAGLLCVAAAPALASDFPTRPINLIASAAPGGTTDIAAPAAPYRSRQAARAGRHRQQASGIAA